MKLTKRQLRRVLKDCTHVTINGFQHEVLGTNPFQDDLAVVVVEIIDRFNATRYIKFSAADLLNASISALHHGLRLENNDLLRFYKITPIRLQDEKTKS